VAPEHVLHRATHLSQGAAVLERLADGGEQVLAASRYGAQLLEASLDELVVTRRLELPQALDLLALGVGIDAEQVGHLDVVLLIGVDADHDVLSDAVALLVSPGGLVDLAGDELDRV